MAKQYEDLKQARFSVDSAEGVETIRIPARRNWLVLPFIALWLLMWTIGGGGAATALLNRFDPFLLLWFVIWAAAWLVAAAIVLWQVWGAEYLRAVGGDLEVGYAFPGFRKSRLYRGSHIRSLTASDTGNMFARMNSALPPFLNWARSGSIKFDYGARTIRAAEPLDEAEGRMIVEHLRRHLPATAVEDS
jgi:hypothetical protein